MTIVTSGRTDRLSLGQGNSSSLEFLRQFPQDSLANQRAWRTLGMQEDRHQPRSRSPGCQQVRPQLGEFLVEAARPHESHPRGDEAPSQLNIEQEQHLHQVGKAEFAEEIREFRRMEPPRWAEAARRQSQFLQDLAPSDQPSPLLRSFQADEFGDLAREKRRAPQ